MNTGQQLEYEDKVWKGERCSIIMQMQIENG